MERSDVSRRDLLRRAGWMAAGAAGGSMATSASASSLAERGFSAPGALDVRDFGAVGDGKKDDTGAFRAAVAAAAEQGGNLVAVPRGDYLLEGTLEVPDDVVLEGVWRGPTIGTQSRGSAIHTTWGEGKADAEPFIVLRRNATLSGLTIFHPKQVRKSPPVPYPWTVRGNGDNCTLRNVLMVNPYQAVDFGTLPAGRHYINGLYAQALYRGLFIDQCYDVGRVENVHFWPFFEVWQTDLKQFTEREGIAFVIGRTDWEYMTNCFCIGYRVGFHFVKTKAGTPNVVLTQCGSDIGPTAVRVSASMDHAGISFSNGQFMATVEVEPEARGPVKFTSCGFWPVPETGPQAVLQGSSHVTFTGCHFSGWDQKNAGVPCIDVRSGGVTVSGCEFMAEGKAQIEIGKSVEAAVVVGNRFRGAQRVTNHAGSRAQIGLNVADAKPRARRKS